MKPIYFLPKITLLLSFLFVTPAFPCGWDRDTIEYDAKYMKDVVSVLVGYFPRNPDLYYELRLKHANEVINKDPYAFPAYDDAGVACDRLGKSDEAIFWMEKKKKQLDSWTNKMKKTTEDQIYKDHLYRYLSNLGTFYVHRFMNQGASRSNLADVKKAHELLQEAIKVNPNAHFGREKYQVRAMAWILNPPPKLVRLSGGFTDEPFLFHVVPDLIGYLQKNKLDPDLKNPNDPIRGLAGLVALGSSWNNIDVFHSLAMVFFAEKNIPNAGLATLRVRELKKQGFQSLYPYSGKESVGLPKGAFHFEDTNDVNWKIKQAYEILRKEAEAWQKARTDYMLPLLQAGKHPDLNPDFWKNFKKPAMPFLNKIKADPQKNVLLLFE